MESTNYGMMAVGLSSAEAERYLAVIEAELGSRQLVVACINSHRNVTISGEKIHLDKLQEHLKSARVFTRQLRVDVAYHSFQMHKIADEYLSKLGILKKPLDLCGTDKPAMVSTVTGTYITANDVCQPEYWIRNLLSPVLFLDAMESICQASLGNYKKLDGSHRSEISVTDLVEIGPHSALRGPIREILVNIKQDDTISYTSLLMRNFSATHTLLQAMGQLHSLGHTLSLAQVNVENTRDMTTLCNLPEYQFNHSKAYWYESRASKGYRFRKARVNDLLGVADSNSNSLEAKWRNIIRTSNLPWLEDHKVRNFHHSIGLTSF